MLLLACLPRTGPPLLHSKMALATTMLFAVALRTSTALPSAGPVTAPPLGFKPSLVFFLADDFGRFNSGWNGNPEARTPHIDSLVKDGIVMDRHYTYKYCSPTRSSFLSGRLPYHVNQANRAYSAVGGVDLRMTLISEHLKAAGYSLRIALGCAHSSITAQVRHPYDRQVACRVVVRG